VILPASQLPSAQKRRWGGGGAFAEEAEDLLRGLSEHFPFPTALPHRDGRHAGGASSTPRHQRHIINTTASTSRHQHHFINTTSSTPRHQYYIIFLHHYYVITNMASVLRNQYYIINATSSTPRHH
jgi:hypothetical protein